MLKFITGPALVALAAAGFVTPAFAESGYAFTVENASPSAMTISAAGKSKCDLAPGKSCRVMVTDMAASFTYAPSGATPIAFTPGNLEMVDHCKIDAASAHCTDTMGQATN